MNTSTQDRDGFDLVSLLRENAQLRIDLADATAEADYLRCQLEQLPPASTAAAGDAEEPQR